jgi:hypothetical protein
LTTFDSNKAWKIPHTVPNKPTKGASEAIVPKTDTPFSALDFSAEI